MNITDKAYNGSYYTVYTDIANDDVEYWKTQYEDLMRSLEIGKPKEWHVVSTDDINDFAEARFNKFNPLPEGGKMLCFPLDGLNVPVLAIFKISMEDRWFDDIVDNMGREWL